MLELAGVELGHFLRTRRHKLVPEELGVPTAARRRAAGLRREEVAARAHMSTSWYTDLEQGRRELHPSAAVLDALATALCLRPTELRYLHALAAGASESVLPEIVPTPAAVAAVAAIVDASSATPHPVYARGDLVAANTHVAEWYDDFSGPTGRDADIVWWLFTAPQARERIGGWADDARDVVARMRYFLGTSRVDRGTRDLVRDLCAASPEFHLWWQTHDVAEQDIRNRTSRHPRLGLRTLQVVVVRPSVSPATSIVFHVPAS